MTVLILARNLPFGDTFTTLDRRQPQAVRPRRAQLVNDTRGDYRLGDASTSHAIDACAHGYPGSPRPAGTLKIGSLRFGIRKAIAWSQAVDRAGRSCVN